IGPDFRRDEALVIARRSRSSVLTQSRKLYAAPPWQFSLEVSDCLCEEQNMQNHRTVLLLTMAFAAISLKAQVATSQFTIPIHTTVSISVGAFFDRVVLSGSMKLTAQNNPTGSCRAQQSGGLCVISTLVDVWGTGLLTGISYRADGASIFSVPPTPVA